MTVAAAATAPVRQSHGRLMLSPSVVVLLAWMLIHLAMTLWFSAERYNLLDPRLKAFAGLSNYADLITHRALWIAMKHALLRGDGSRSHVGFRKLGASLRLLLVPIVSSVQSRCKRRRPAEEDLMR